MRARGRIAMLTVALIALTPQLAHAEGDQPVGDSSAPRYVFPFSRVPVRYARDHLDYHPDLESYLAAKLRHAP